MADSQCQHYWNDYNNKCVRMQHINGDHIFRQDLAIDLTASEQRCQRLEAVVARLDDKCAYWEAANKTEIPIVVIRETIAGKTVRLAAQPSEPPAATCGGSIGSRMCSRCGKDYIGHYGERCEAPTPPAATCGKWYEHGDYHQSECQLAKGHEGHCAAPPPEPSRERALTTDKCFYTETVPCGGNIYYKPDSDNFYCDRCNKGQGLDYYNAHIAAARGGQ